MTPDPRPSWDPLQYGLDLPLRAAFYPLGFPLEIRTNSADVLAAAEQSWPRSQRSFDATPIRLGISVSNDEPLAAPTAPTLRARDHLLSLAADSHHFAACDLESGTGACWVSAAVARSTTHFRYHYLEALVYFMLSYQHLTPLHGSCVAKQGRGVLLSGKPGAGKSCLAYACACAGLTFVTDDVAYLVRRSADCTLLGRPAYLRFKPPAADLFGELRAFAHSTDAGGETVLEVRTDQIAGVRSSPSCELAHVIFLERHSSGESSLTSLDRTEALERLVRDLPLCPEEVIRQQVDSLRRLLQSECYTLRFSDPHEAAGRIAELLEGGSG